ncbi:MAG: hypothetical protein DRI34_03560 [Deltaproteobacteria bacterium]|nr:MAG: hypothetical protein DRI34_03560 [Deltaproteobacteria bacterium]
MKAGLEIAALLLAAGLAGASTASAGRQHPVRQDLQETEKRLQRQKRLLEKLQGRSTRLLEELSRLEQQDQQLRNEQEQAQQALEQCRRRLERLARRRRKLLHLEDDSRRDLARRLRILYKRGEYGWLELLFSSADLGQALERVRWLHRRARLDARLVGQLERLQQQLQKNQRQTRQQARQQDRLIAELRGRREQLQQLRQQRLAVLGLVRRQASLRQKALRELVRARRRLQGVLQRFEGGRQSSSEFSSWRGRLPAPLARWRVEVPFGLQKDRRFGTVTRHQGVDLRAPRGTPVRVVFPGRVAFADWFEGYGLLVIVEHGGGFYTLYAHLDDLRVHKGQRLRQGQLLGGVGETGSLKGPYLYFEIRRGGKAVDPARWIKH